MDSFKQLCLCLLVILCITLRTSAQVAGSVPLTFTLQDCIDYATSHQPYVQQAKIDEAITERIIKSKLADWYPQINLGYNVQHYLQLPSAINPFSQKNNATTAASATQNVFNRDVVLASKTAGDVRLNARQNTQLTRIDMVLSVSKAFYDVLVSSKQIDILDQDILRLQKSLKDSYAQYQAGTADKTDYKRATILLNNSLATKKQYEELLKAKLAFLKEQMGYTGSALLKLVYDDQKLEEQVMSTFIDPPSYQSRVEFQQLETQRKLLKYNLKYAKWSYLPTVSLFGNYNLVAQNNAFSKVYSEVFPNSIMGVTLAVPIFQGGKRLQGIKQAELELLRLDWDFKNLEAIINTDYTSALATYKASLNDYSVSKENLSLAHEVYNTIQLQYMSGVKAYLDVIVSETDLRTAEVSILDALYQVLSSKLDLQKAAGTINY